MNKMKTAFVSTLYPSSGGVATYSRDLYRELSNLDKNVIFLADKVKTTFNGDKNIIRCWDHDVRYVYQIIKQVFKNKIKNVHFQQELHLYGSKITAFLLSLLILLLD